MAALLVAMGVMAVVVSTTMPVFSTLARRERETELIFRGQQYARAVSLFQRKYGNALPPNLDVLLTERFLRKAYKDPITGGEFQVIGPASPELALAGAAPPAQQQQGRGGPPLSQQQPRPQQPQSQQSPFQQPQLQQQQTGRGGFGASGFNATQAPGGIIGVVSKSRETSLRIFNNRDKYNEWVFVATQMSITAGGPPGTQTPGSRGGGAPGIGPGRDGRGGRGNQPNDGRGGFGQPLPGPGGRNFGRGQPSRGRF
jgi:type II secretory pathway pseudopilin PulG